MIIHKEISPVKASCIRKDKGGVALLSTDNALAGNLNMKTKVCTRCGINKPHDEFYSRPEGKLKLGSRCKKCLLISKFNYSRTKKGLIGRIYSNQVSHSIFRQHESPTYTRIELISWLFNNHEFHEIYNNWVLSGYNKLLTPSVDRIDDYKSYKINNIRITTWGENLNSAHSDMINGVNRKSSRAVLCYSKENVLIAKYHSIHNAAREVGIEPGNIYYACSGRYKTSGGYIWKFKDSVI